MVVYLRACASSHVGIRLLVREGVIAYDIHYESKSYKLKLLGKLVVQQG